MIKGGKIGTEGVYRMKKLISLALILCLLTGAVPAPAETAAYTLGWEPAAGYVFDFTLRLHPESLSEPLRKKASGYADLLDALRFQGSVVWSLVDSHFDLNLSVIPADRAAEPVSVRIHGAADLMFIESPLLGEKRITLSNTSLLNFCSKMSEHLGIPLHYAALLFPYTWTYGLGLPLDDWNGFVKKEKKDGTISAKAVHYLWECWAYRRDHDEPLMILLDALCRDSEMEEAFRAMVDEIPDYVEQTVAREQGIQIIRDGKNEIWRAASGDFYTVTDNGKTRWASLNLPKMKTGYLPVFSLQTTREDDRLSARFEAQILSTDGMQDDLVNLQGSLTSFPTSWPAGCQSLLGVSLTGGLLPNIGFCVYLAGEEDGHVYAEVRKPTVDMEPGAVMLSLDGHLTPMEGDVTILEFAIEDLEGSLDLLVANDATLRSFLPDVAMPMLEGMIRFLVGVPTSACQTIMDDLTELGVLDLLLGE